MKHFQHFIFYEFVFLAAGFYSCIPEPLEVTGIPVVKPQLVVTSQIIPDESLVIILTKTFGALDANGESDPEDLFAQIAVSDALVVLKGPVQTDTLLAIDEGIYGGVFIPFEVGATYKLFVKSETLGEVTAETQVMPAVTFDDIEASLYYTGFDDTLAQVTYRVIDPLEKNWYMLNVQEIEQKDLEENLLNPRAFTRLVADDEFNNTSYTETFRVFPRDYSSGDTIAVSISNISEPYYRFMELRLDNRFSFIEYLNEPVNYPTNIVGGKVFLTYIFRMSERL